MPTIQNLDFRRALADRIRYYNELGIYDFYRRSRDEQPPEGAAIAVEPEIPSGFQPELRVEMSPRKSVAVVQPTDENIFEVLTSKPEQSVTDPITALKLIREDLGDCTRCKLHQQGRTQIVFGVGNPQADLMFVGEGPGADEDAQGEPFVGRAGQLLNNMIKAMGLRRDDVYIANVVKCRPPGNRTPERDECDTCSPFLMRQITVIRPKVIVALGAVAAKNLLAINAPMTPKISGSPICKSFGLRAAKAGFAHPSEVSNTTIATMNPAMGPAIAMSNSAARECIRERIRMTAPIVPTGVGNGMKNGNVAWIP